MTDPATLLSREPFDEVKMSQDYYIGVRGSRGLKRWKLEQQGHRFDRKKILLWNRVRDVLERSKKNRWGTNDVDSSYADLPSYSTFKDALGIGEDERVTDELESNHVPGTGSRFVMFGWNLRRKREEIVEDPAGGLIGILESNGADHNSSIEVQLPYVGGGSGGTSGVPLSTFLEQRGIDTDIDVRGAVGDLSHVDRVVIATMAMRRLGESALGRQFLSKQFTDPDPVFDPFELLEPPIRDGDDDRHRSKGLLEFASSANQDVYRDTYPELVLQLVTGATSAYQELKHDDGVGGDVPQRMATDFLLRALRLFVGEHVAGVEVDFGPVRDDTRYYDPSGSGSGAPPSTLHDIAETLKNATSVAREVTNPGRAGSLFDLLGHDTGDVSSSLNIALAGLTVFAAIVDEEEGGDVLDVQEGFGIAKATIGLVDWDPGHEMWASVADGTSATTASMLRKTAFIVGTLLNLIDIAIDIAGALDADERGDTSVVVGYSLAAVGSAIGLFDGVLTFYGSSIAELLACGPPGWVAAGVLTVITAITLTGAALIAWTQDHPLEVWMGKCYFGIDWEDTQGDDADPDEMWFRWNTLTPPGVVPRDRDHRPNFGRQVSTMLSISSGFGFSSEDYERDDFTVNGRSLTDYWNGSFRMSVGSTDFFSVLRVVPVQAHANGYVVGRTWTRDSNYREFQHQFPLAVYRDLGCVSVDGDVEIGSSNLKRVDHTAFGEEDCYSSSGTIDADFLAELDYYDEIDVGANVHVDVAVPPEDPSLVAWSGFAPLVIEIDGWHVDCYSEYLTNLYGIPPDREDYSSLPAGVTENDHYVEGQLLDTRTIQNLQGLADGMSRSFTEPSLIDEPFVLHDRAVIDDNW